MHVPRDGVVKISIDKQWANDAGGKFENVVGEAIDELIGTMARRSAVLDMAGLCDYEASDAWKNYDP